MMKKLLWPATLLAAFALPAACGGGSTDSDNMGGEGGQDGETGGSSSGGTTGGSSSGGQSTGGGAGEGGMAGSGSGGGPIIVQPETCSDGDQNEMETDVDCGGPDCDPCDDDGACRQDSDCDSGVCDNLVCAAPECGDRVKNGDEECDDGGDSEDCNADCTLVVCGDGYVNAVAEDCEPDVNLDIWQRCSSKCLYGVDLDGTWRINDVPGANSPWEILKGASVYGSIPGTQSFHYLDMPYIYDLSSNTRYDIKTNEWSALPNPLPYSTVWWENAAVDSAGLWVPRGSSMYRLDLETLEWTTPSVDIPDGGDGVTGSAAVYDGAGFIWYVGFDPNAGGGVGEDVLVKYDPADGGFQTFSWLASHPTYAAHEPRVGYDPLTDRVAFISYNRDPFFLVFDLASEEFTAGQPLPDASAASDNTCQDRAGGIYVTTQSSNMFRYDVGADTFEQVPALPAPDDVGSVCVVSEAGYLYYGTAATDPVTGESTFRRLRLNHR